MEKFVCVIYGMKKITSINDARAQIFFDKYKQKKKDGERLSFVKKLDGSALPPCAKVLMQKMKRTHFVARQWLSTTSSCAPVMSPEDHGWKLVDGGYKLFWFEGDASPRSLDVVCDDTTLQLEGTYLFPELLIFLF